MIRFGLILVIVLLGGSALGGLVVRLVVLYMICKSSRPK
jgi:hypothetical protein